MWRSFIVLLDGLHSFSLSLSLYLEVIHCFLTFQNDGSISDFLVATVSRIFLVSLLKV